MQGNVFLQILNMSFTGGIVIAFVLLARLLLKRAPKIFSYALWAVVLFRLVCPFSFESVFSLLPTKANPIAQDIAYMQTPTIDTGVAAINNPVNALLPAGAPDASINPLGIWLLIGSVVWLMGIAILLAYSLIILLRLKRRLKAAARYTDHVFLTDKINTAFVLGVIRPKIYLPANLNDKQKEYILLHEQTHIKRFDHLTKLLSFFVLCLHWFNPLVWVAFFVSGKDMEMSCDEAVVKNLGNDIKKAYSTSLLTLATGRRMISGTPLAFGEGDTKGRIKNVLSYKKPAFWVVLVAAVAVIFLGVGLFLNPATDAALPNSLYTAKLSVAQEAKLTTQYELDSNSHIFESKFHVADSIKSYVYYVELYQYGEYRGTYVENMGNFSERQGSIVTAFSMNRGENDAWESLRWTTSFIDGGYSSHPNLPFPNGFTPVGVAASTIASAGADTVTITPESPILLASISFQGKNGPVSSYDCGYLMENPSAIAQYECVYLVKCVFSEKDETELEKTLPINPTGSAGVNAVILEIDKDAQTMTVEGVDQNSVIGDKCILTWGKDALITVAANSEPKQLTLDDFSVGDSVVLFIGAVQDTYPTRATASTIQLQPAGAPSPVVEYSIARIGKDGTQHALASLQSQEIAQAVLMDGLVKSAAWEGVDITTMEEYYLIRWTFPETNEVHDYYAYRLKDGTAVVQTGASGRYSILSEELYVSLEKYVVYLDAQEPVQAEKDTNYSQSLTPEELAQTEKAVRNYFTTEAPYFEGVVSIALAPDDYHLYQNTGIEGEYEAGNIIIYIVLTGRDKKDHTPERSVSVARATRDDAWKVISHGY